MNKTIINKVKTTVKAVLPFSVFALLPIMSSSCSDFLELEPRDEIILEQFWNEKADVDGILAGCYSGLQSDAVIRRMMIWGEFRSDNIGVGLNIDRDGNLENVLKENITAKNAYTTWDAFYSVINRCNTLIKYAPDVAAKDPGYTESELQANIAEVTAIRCLTYFYLIRAFRDVPYTTEAYTDDDQPMELPATAFDDVLDSLIVSLESVKDMAIKRYPVTKPIYQTGRITRDAINAMLCEMYLWKKDYQRCIEYADLVIESKKAIAEENDASSTTGRTGRGRTGTSGSGSNYERYNGYPLLDEAKMSNYYGEAYSELFGSDTYAKTASQEIIFSLVFDDTPIASGMLANSAVNTFYGHASVDRGLVAPSDYVLEDIEKTASRSIFADRNKLLDARMYEAVNSKQKSVNKFTTTEVNINVTIPTSPDSPPSMRYPENDNGSNWIIYRLTDIMLLKAEALVQTMLTGSEQATIDFNAPILAQAFSLVNAVNKRAVCQSNLTDTLLATDYSTKAQMEELVMRERQRELMFEGKRWFDLVRQAQRTGSTDAIAAAAVAKAGSNATMVQNMLTKMDAIYWPYNLEELKVNHQLVQNPAFGSGENDSYEKNY